MAELSFKDLVFQQIRDKVRVFFLKNFYFDASKEELDKIGSFSLGKNNHKIFFEGREEIVKRNFNNLLEQKMQKLISLQGKPATYVYKGFLPLIGSLYFGIIDRNTNIIEVRPISGCNLNCIFCSVNMEKRVRDFVVNADYLIEEAKKLAKLKLEKVYDLEIHINAQGEPLLYEPLPELVRGLAKIKGVSTISIDTNGCFLTKEKIDELVKAGITRFNVSINAFSKQSADKISGTNYPFEHVIEMCRHIANRCDILLASVWMKGINDKDIEEIIKFSIELSEIRNKNKPEQKTPFVGIQNFLEYKFGKKPCKQMDWKEFSEKLKLLEKKYKVKLVFSRDDFKINEAIVLEKPFKKGSVVEAEIVCEGSLKNEKLAKAQDRTITVVNSDKNSGRTRVKITRSKYNVFYAKEV